MAATVKAAKKPPAKTRRPEPQPTAEPDDGFEVLRLTTQPEEDDAEGRRVPLFYIDDHCYTIAARPRMNVALQFMRLSRHQSDTAAMDYLLDQLLGEDGYQALREYDQLTPKQFQHITRIASELALGALELPKA